MDIVRTREKRMITKVISVNDIGDAEPVTAQTVCQRIKIREKPGDPAWPTTDFTIYKPDKTNDGEPMLAGEWYEFPRPPGIFWNPGEIAGYVATASGTVDFIQDES